MLSLLCLLVFKIVLLVFYAFFSTEFFIWGFRDRVATNTSRLWVLVTQEPNHVLRCGFLNSEAVMSLFMSKVAVVENNV